jgi:hypothetical protein
LKELAARHTRASTAAATALAGCSASGARTQPMAVRRASRHCGERQMGGC